MSAPPVYKLEKDLCRCCHAEGSFVKLSDTVYNGGQAEVFSEMLQNTLDLEILPMEGDYNLMTFTICGQCVLRLRDAHNFKQQVTVCEQRFKEMYNNMVLSAKKTMTIIEIKEEIPATFEEVVKKEESNDEDDFNWKFEDSDDNQPVANIKVEEVKIVKPVKPKPKPKPKPKSKQKKAPANRPSAEPQPETSKDPKDPGTPSEGPEDPSGVPWWHRDAKPPEETNEQKKLQKGSQRPVEDTDYRVEGGNYFCCHCEKVFSRSIRGNYRHKQNLMQHIKYKHFKKPAFFCRDCKLGYKSKSGLYKHNLQEHNIDDRKKCNACDGAFNTQLQLDNHLKGFHKLGERLKCDTCEYETFLQFNLDRHKLVHKAERKFQCGHCVKSFKRKTTLALHEKIHTNDKRKVCKECGKAFVQKASLNYHMTKYHPEVPF